MKRANKAQVAKASAALERAEHNLRIVKFMVHESMARMHDVLNGRGVSLRTLHIAAADVTRDAGELYGDTAVVAELRDWLKQARAGKRRRLRGGPAKWPSMAKLYGARAERRRRRAERTAKWEDENP